jgi:hypothetical protein
MFTVYAIRHDDGREYVGCTAQFMEMRWRGHCAQSRSPHNGPNTLWAAMAADGPDAFVVEVLATFDTHEEADAFERFQIIHRKTRWPNGFNHRKGGGGRPRNTSLGQKQTFRTPNDPRPSMCADGRHRCSPDPATAANPFQEV